MDEWMMGYQMGRTDNINIIEDCYICRGDCIGSGSLSAGVVRVQLLKGSEGVGTTRAGKRVHARGEGDEMG